MIYFFNYRKGYKQDKNGRWHKDGKYVSNAELGIVSINAGNTNRTEVQRQRWKEYTGQDPTGEVHHGLPEEFSDWFASRGLDVNSGEFYYDLPADIHRYKSGNGLHTNNSPLGKDWNVVWAEFIENNPRASKKKI